MRDLSDSIGSFGYGETSGEAGNAAAPLTGKAFFQDLIRRANTVPLIRILTHCGVRVNIHNKIICPFKSHKGGRERTPSFEYYQETNSFYCHGCKIGGKSAHACEFMAAFDGIKRTQAAYKIINLFGSDIGDPAEVTGCCNFSEQLEIMMDFSNIVKDFRKLYLDKEAQIFIEERCETYDELCAKLEFKSVLDNDTLYAIVGHLKEQINFYKSCHML